MQLVCAHFCLFALSVSPHRVDLHGEKLKAACAKFSGHPSLILHVALGIGMAHVCSAAGGECAVCWCFLLCRLWYRADGTLEVQ